ncbi:carbohydrate ABC transporter permease [Syntrophomonas palmitatica]|uniref:carbohydrate ABC transporter permease n=1 Tax=Syntrophomonas palmitatica TaxID=402877 RepID=UPI0006D05C46|nr:carbohydrate ABC transporter permease [Syntrophomonas palmitatica]
MKIRSNLLFNTIKLLILGLIAFVLSFPIIIAFFTALKPPGEIFTAEPSILPHIYTLQNYIDLFSIREFPNYLLNSLLVASTTALITLIIASLAACAIVWMKFPAKQMIVRSILFTYMFPEILLVIPLFLLCYHLNLVDTKAGLVLTYLSFSLPFSIWMLKSFFESLSIELIEAALLDGCSYAKLLRKVVLPVSLPGVTAVMIFSFILAWSEYLFANTLIVSDTNRTIAIGLQTLLGYYRTDYGLLTAASMVMVLPVLAFFIAVQKYFIKGLTVGAVKE